MREYVLGFLTNPSLSRVLLIQKARPAWQFGLLNGVGGAIEPGETPEQAMIREYEEETPFKMAMYQTWEHYATMDKRGEWLVHVFHSQRAWHTRGVDLMSPESRETRNLDHPEFLGLLENWNKQHDEPLYVVETSTLLTHAACIPNLAGLIGFIRDTMRTEPMQLRY